jgi:hypothetical protein
VEAAGIMGTKKTSTMPRTSAAEIPRTAPDDGDSVLAAIRLGWYVAEVGGRNNPNCPQPRAGEARKMVPSPLPLRNERTAAELETEAEGVLVALAARVLAAGGAARAEQIRADAAALRRHRDPEGTDVVGLGRHRDLEDAEALRAALNQSIFEMDTAAQDGLTAISDTQACGYLLGRGLAECYWALDLKEPDESWPRVLGEERVGELTRLAGRLSEYFNAYTATAVAGTLAAWQVIALKKRWRDEPQVADSLFLQIRRWYEVIVLLQDPSSLIRPRAIFTNYRAILHGVVAFLPQLLLATGALGLIAWFVDLLNTQAGYAFGKSVLAIAGVLGLSLTSISARLKNTAQSLTLRIKQNAFGDLIAAELTVVPGRPGRLSGLSGRKSKRRDRQMARAVQNRTLTSITPAKCR